MNWKLMAWNMWHEMCGMIYTAAFRSFLALWGEVGKWNTDASENLTLYEDLKKDWLVLFSMWLSSYAHTETV